MRYLIDDVYEKTFTPWAKDLTEMFFSSTWRHEKSDLRRSISSTIVDIRHKLENCERIILEHSAVQQVSLINVPPIEELPGYLSLGKPGKRFTWIEYDNIQKCSFQDSIRASGRRYLTDDTPSRVGWLLEVDESDHNLWIANCICREADGSITIFPGSMMFNARCDGEPLLASGIRSVMSSLKILKGLQKAPDDYSSPSSFWDNVRGACWGIMDEGGYNKIPLNIRGGFSFGFEPITHNLSVLKMANDGIVGTEAVQEMVTFCAQQSAGDATFLVCLLSMMNSVEVEIIESGPRGTFDAKGGGGKMLQPRLDYTVRTVVIPRKVRKNYVAREVSKAAAAHLKKRRHFVDPHERTYHRGTPEEFKINIEKHERGDKSRGWAPPRITRVVGRSHD